jgi:hypothetical protein
MDLACSVFEDLKNGFLRFSSDQNGFRWIWPWDGRDRHCGFDGAFVLSGISYALMQWLTRLAYC